MGGSAVSRFFLVSWCVVVLEFAPAQSYCQTIILRDLQIIDSVAIGSMTVEGVALADGRGWSWDQIQEGDVGTRQQVEFDRWRTEIGEQLFRVRQRLANGDISSLQPHADNLAAMAIQYDSTSSVYFLACCAQLRSFLYQKNRVAALMPLLEILRLRESGKSYLEFEKLSGLHFTDSGICEELLPIWFDADAARTQIAQIRKSDTFPITSPGGAEQLYLNTLAIAAGESSILFESPSADDPWRLLYSAQSALLAGDDERVVRELDVNLFRDSAERHAIALYYLAMAQSRLQSPEIDQEAGRNRPRWMLTFLTIPALYEDRFPELAAAAISQVVNHAEVADQIEFEGLLKELAGRYRQTTFGTTRK